MVTEDPGNIQLKDLQCAKSHQKMGPTSNVFSLLLLSSYMPTTKAEIKF